MRRSRLAVVTAATASAALSLPLRAHHSVEDTYDSSKTVTLTGVVPKLEWANPHVRLFVEVKGATGDVTTWCVETEPPRQMERLGLTPAMLGQAEITVDVWLAKDGSRSASGRTLRMPDGTAYDVASGLDWRPVQGASTAAPCTTK
jgi:hypothetical protein